MTIDDCRTGLEKISPSVFFIRGTEKNCNSYLIRGKRGYLLIDPGSMANFQRLQKILSASAIEIPDIALIINTHEHHAHSGASVFFQDSAFIAAHRLAAAKMTSYRGCRPVVNPTRHEKEPFRVDLWLGEDNTIDTGHLRLSILHTPGHTCGSVCLYEARQFLLFAGDTLRTEGNRPCGQDCESPADLSVSLSRLAMLKIAFLLPGHGPLSERADRDIEKAMERALPSFNPGGGHREKSYRPASSLPDAACTEGSSSQPVIIKMGMINDLENKEGW